MADPLTPTQPYLTTKEVADLLRVKERKVYDLAAADEIPHRRITGKLLFPRQELMAWIEGPEETAAGDRPAVLAGSHDPLLDWAVRDSDCGLATLLNGSTDGLDRFEEGSAALSGLHIPDSKAWNIRAVTDRGFINAVLIGWTVRKRGLILGQGMDGIIRSVRDLAGKRVVLRQPGAGAAALLDQLLANEGLGRGDLVAAAGVARTESDAAAAVASGEADAAMGIEAMARQFGLPFLPLVDENFDLLIDRRSYFTPPIQTLLDFARSDTLRQKAKAMGGYDMSALGHVRWLSP